MSKETIRVPDVGSSDPVDVIEVSVKKGDNIAAEDTIVVLESDKASLEVPAPKGGTVLELLVKAGDRVKQGDPLLELDAESGNDSGDQDADDDQKAGASGDSDDQEAAQSDEKGEQEDEQERQKESQKDSQKENEQSEKAGDDANTPKGGGSAGGGEQAVKVPDLGDIDEAEIIEISVAEGDSVEAEQTILVLESDKASLEVPSPAAGTVKKLHVKVGDKVTGGSEMMTLATEGGDASGDDEKANGKQEAEAARKPAGDDKAAKGKQPAAEQSSGKSASKSASKSDPQPAPARREGQPSKTVHAGPAVRKLAREAGVDLAEVSGSGPKDRVVKEDVHAHIKNLLERRASGGGVSADLPEIDFSEFGPVERVALNKLRKVAAKNLHRSWITVPHVTQFDEADITELEAFRKSQNKALEKEGVKLTMLAFLVKACATALREFPRFNSSLELGGEALIQKDYVHIGIAVDTPNGLVVPVIRDADKKGLKEIASEMGELAGKARDRKLSPADMKGACFSISSLGGIGGTAFTPIVNWPEVAILGVSRSDTKPVWDGKAFQPRLTLPLSLSYDHRVIDGADAARFTTYLSMLLADMRRALL
ncbi:dihydrolipoyllysine-residue acetyltransferase [Alloalcanivorax mobilis]|uniref:dihydrolipoyllysine-residue acetyltransferase n=1 Tax=Alloalcanivorax mobilis TaxID=2019569 RepID=UPI000C791E92|nr:dihydrolipoyllysine-residue acetyltransferase [Alloalcanivorax mobilis]